MFCSEYEFQYDELGEIWYSSLTKWCYKRNTFIAMVLIHLVPLVIKIETYPTQEPRLIPLATTTVSRSIPVIFRFTLLPHKSLFI